MVRRPDHRARRQVTHLLNAVIPAPKLRSRAFRNAAGTIPGLQLKFVSHPSRLSFEIQLMLARILRRIPDAPRAASIGAGMTLLRERRAECGRSNPMPQKRKAA